MPLWSLLARIGGTLIPVWTRVRPGRTGAFSDSSCNSGPAQLGLGEWDEATIVNGGPSSARFTTTYFRQTFSVTDPAAFTNLAMWLLRDDGGVVYLNGKDVYRSPSMPQPPTVIVYGSWATNQSVSSAPADNFIDATASSTIWSRAQTWLRSRFISTTQPVQTSASTSASPASQLPRRPVLIWVGSVTSWWHIGMIRQPSWKKLLRLQAPGRRCRLVQPPSALCRNPAKSSIV